MSNLEDEMPWAKGLTPQENGKKVEKERAKYYGARVHPGSGSGRIKHDASNAEELIEFKEVAKSHSLNGNYCNQLYTRAVQQEKEALYVVTFTEANITAEIRLRRT